MIAAIILVPMVLILGATVGTVALAPESPWQPVLTFLGTPTIALTIAVLLAMYLLGTRRGMTVTELGRITGESLQADRHDPAGGRGRRVLRRGAAGHRGRARRWPAR